MPKKQTVEEFLASYLENRYLFNDQAKEIVGQFKTQPDSISMIDRWTDAVTDYPTSLITTLVMRLRPVALTWIDTNCPEAFFRSEFVDAETSVSA